MANSTVGATIAELMAQFPKAFTLDPARVRPLKLGVREDLYALSGISHRRIIEARDAAKKAVQSRATAGALDLAPTIS
jgi:ProQ/FINO family